MKTYYWTAKPNFGDLLTPLLIKRFCFLETELTTPQDSQLVMVGSLLHHLPQGYKGVIAGSGSLHARTYPYLSQARILAVRGPFTLSTLPFKKGYTVTADPGLLADELVPPQDRVYELGIVPHWSDPFLGKDPRFIQYPHLVINVADDPIKVITQIAQCKKIVSSSLHAIILADAFSIPRRIEIAPDMISNPHEGGVFKWLDYSTSINMRFEVGVTQEPSRNTITEKQHELFDVMGEIKSIFSKDV